MWDVCEICGAVVAASSIHEEWHRSIQGIEVTDGE